MIVPTSVTQLTTPVPGFQRPRLGAVHKMWIAPLTVHTEQKNIPGSVPGRLRLQATMGQSNGLRVHSLTQAAYLHACATGRRSPLINRLECGRRPLPPSRCLSLARSTSLTLISPSARMRSWLPGPTIQRLRLRAMESGRKILARASPPLTWTCARCCGMGGPSVRYSQMSNHRTTDVLSKGPCADSRLAPVPAACSGG